MLCNIRNNAVLSKVRLPLKAPLSKSINRKLGVMPSPPTTLQ